MINLLGSKGGILEMDDLGFYTKSINDIKHSGSMLQLDAITSFYPPYF